MTDQVRCDTHGTVRATYMCRHLCEGIACGFQSADPDDDLADAWCDLCQRAYEQYGGWTEESEAVLKVRLVCSDCYGGVRDRNQHVPPHARGRDGRISPAEWPALVGAAAAQVATRNAETDARWRWKGEPYRFDGNAILLGDPPHVVADTVPLAVWSPRDAIFEWSWADLRYDDIERLRAFGEVRELATFAEPRWRCSVLDEAHAAVAAAAYILGAECVWTCGVGGGTAWLLLSNFRALS